MVLLCVIMTVEPHVDGWKFLKIWPGRTEASFILAPCFDSRKTLILCRQRYVICTAPIKTATVKSA